MELRPWLNKKVDELSKGMQQKIQFIATIVHDPEILILDEPFSGLDPLNVALMREYFLDFRARGKTIIFCTHVLEQAEKLCDEICLMAKSKKILEGSLKDLKRRNSQRPAADLRSTPASPTSRRCPASPRPRPSTGPSSSISPPASPRRSSSSARSTPTTVEAFSQKEPDLEEIYIDAVHSAGMEETRTIE